MPDWDDDERLAEGYQRDADSRALETLYRRHVHATYGFAHRMLGSREDAEEATSECWLRAFRHLRDGRYRGEARFRTWLFGIARLVCLERIRQPRLPTLSLSDLGDHERDGLSLFAPPPAAAGLGPALDSLSEDHRLVLTLCDLQGFTAAEAAEIMHRTGSSVKSLQLRARRALRDALTREKDAS